MLGTVWQDIRYGIRTLLKNRSFTVIVLAVLALGIGANTAIFSVMNAVLLRSLPYGDEDRIMMVWENDTKEGNPKNAVAPGNFVDFKEQNQVFDNLAVYTQPSGVNLTGADEPERVEAAGISANLFTVLGVKPALGRALLPDEDKPTATPVAIITNGLWQRRFGADSGIINRTLMLDGNNYTVVGVLPPDFELPERVQAFIPFPMVGNRATSRTQHFLRVLGHLKPGVSVEQARQNLEDISRRLQQQYPETNAGRRATVIPIKEQFVGDVRYALLVLFAAVGCVLLIACTNVANLLLTRGNGRQREFAARAALGASRGRIIQQLLIENALLALLGGALGLLIASGIIKLFITFVRTVFPRGAEVGISPMVLIFTLVISVLTGLFFGLLPALQLSKPDLNAVLKEGGRSSTDGSRVHRIGNALVVTEIAISLLLLVCAGLIIKSFLRLQRVDPGFNAENVLTMQISLPNNKYRQNEQIAGFYRQLHERIQGLPGVRASSLISRLPLAGDRATASVTVEGRPVQAGELLEAHYRVIGSDYFRLMSIPLLNGREFMEQDSDKALPVVIINESMAQSFWPREDPVGKRVRLGADPAAPWTSVVGVVRDALNFGLDADARYEVYVPYLQDPPPRARLVVRTASDPLSLVNPIKGQIGFLDKNLPVSEITTMEKLLADSIAQKRFSMMLLSLFACLALALAAMGIYGVISYSVTQRTHEIGIRMALGANRRDILNLIVGQGAKLALIGVGIGLVAALFLTRALVSLLYGVSATDPIVFVGLAILLAGITLLACFIPAWRATKINSMTALRHD
jgi:putative ABC transport system permease protein